MPKIDNRECIYLAGGATHNPEFAVDWREKASLLLPDYRCLSPFRGKKLDTSGKWDVFEQNEIVMRDLHDISRSRLVLAEMMIDGYNYIGTSMEIRTAAERGIPVVMWTEKFSNHYWIRFHTVKCLPTLEECCNYINTYWGE